MTENRNKTIAQNEGSEEWTHDGPFKEISTRKSTERLQPAFLKKFVVPFYLNIAVLADNKEEVLEEMQVIAKDINEDVVAELLAHYNWRTRIVGAFFAGVFKMSAFRSQIENLLLKSELPHAGQGYCMALAALDHEDGVECLNVYLDHYLNHRELRYDQDEAMAAIAYLDKQNGTEHLEHHMAQWNIYNEDHEWDLNRISNYFDRNMTALKEIAEHMA